MGFPGDALCTAHPGRGSSSGPEAPRAGHPQQLEITGCPTTGTPAHPAQCPESGPPGMLGSGSHFEKITLSENWILELQGRKYAAW